MILKCSYQSSSFSEFFKMYYASSNAIDFSIMTKTSSPGFISIVFIISSFRLMAILM
ncbi:hypothetical protein [Escherichia phage IMM-001]|nr:hypothetical protein [Escherichia phage IMM-001]